MAEANAGPSQPRGVKLEPASYENLGASVASGRASLLEIAATSLYTKTLMCVRRKPPSSGEGATCEDELEREKVVEARKRQAP